MGMNARAFRPVVCASSVALLAAASFAAQLPGESGPPPRLNDYEWMGPAPIVVVGLSRGANGPVEEFLVERTLRGDLPPGEVVRVRVRRANRELSENSPHERLLVEPDERYVLLLEPGRRRGARIDYELTRGVLGARPLPAEGRQAVIDALARFVEIHRRNDHEWTWSELRAMLEEEHPLLLGTALDQFLKFRRGDPALLPRLTALLSHAEPRLREQSARLVGSILERHRDEPLDEGSALRAELVSRARRDGSVEVRVAATRALDGLPGTAIDDVLAEIARDDPDQHVRYAAERLLWERRRATRENEAARPAGRAAAPSGSH